MTYLQRLILLLVLIGLLSGSAAAQTGEFHILATPMYLTQLKAVKY